MHDIDTSGSFSPATTTSPHRAGAARAMAPAGGTPPGLVELRRYRLHPGRREDLISMFARVFAGALEADGMQVLGEFRDAGQPDHFVWLRGFPSDSPQERAAALDRFYGGPVWAKHREAANATMVDSDDVLLLRPLTPFRAAKRGPVSLTVALLDSPPPTDELPSGEGMIAVLVTAGVPNLYPALPVRDEHAMVWLQAGEEAAPPPAALVPRLLAEPQISWLTPTSASLVPAL
jgi:hypothetical protein